MEPGPDQSAPGLGLPARSKNMFESADRVLKRIHPAYLVIFSYLSAALIGMALLSLPQASTGEPVSPLDALFTSTSAICVTGLIVVDTGSQFTIFGKMVILILIQMGGLGVMTFSVFLFLFLGRKIGTRERWIINETFTAAPTGDIKNLIKLIFVFTFIMEVAGALVLSFVFLSNGMASGEAAFSGIFHSVSAFCNAGFSFFSSSFIAYRENIILNVAVMLLIIIGGIGFPVIYEVTERIRRRGQSGRKLISLHTRMVLSSTVVLILSGAVILFLFEGGAAFRSLSGKGRLLTSLFQSVTTRTAGFNTIDIPSLKPAALMILIMLMFVGASPGSCGGGIKTTALAVFAGIVKSRIKGMRYDSFARRTIPEEITSRVFSIFILAVLTVSIGLLLLLLTQEPGDTEFFYLAYLFEAVSAFATVGLSMGVTSAMTWAGKIIIILMMLTGRVGLLTIAYVLTRKKRKVTYKYAEEKVMIG
ncbi:MAG: potassium transporter [Candidatus Latescibacteria bacterium]|nr:potassium transporter [bacterium]MBD3422965.1 potassium transporter [Candidatus Latescibacterota bacterium]